MDDIILTIIVVVILGAGNSVADNTVTCVYESWSGVRGLYGNLLGDDIPADLCTHVVYTYASIYVSHRPVTECCKI